MRRTVLRAAAAAIAALAPLGACRDLPTAVTDAPVPAANPARAALRCTVQVRARTMACQVPPGPRGIRSNILLGGQGLNVRLTSTNVQFDSGTGVMTADVTLQNLLDQPMGTNGADTTGSRVFFSSGPVATQGSGVVTVLADSSGTFLGSNEPYYVYPGAIDPRGVSAPVGWSFSVGAGVTAFEFLVLIDTQLPAETSILHWRPERGTQVFPGTYYNVWAASPHDAFAASDGTVVHFDGNYWRAMDADPCGCSSYAVGGVSATDVWAVGAGGSALHWTGGAWQPEETGLPGNDLYAVWAAATNDVWAVGAFGNMVRWDGSSWSRPDMSPSVESYLYGVWGSGPNDVWAVGESGTVVHWDGSTLTSSQPAAISATASLNAVWGTAPNDVWAAGSEDGGPGRLYHFDGTDWTEITDPAVQLTAIYGGWSGGANDVYLAQGGGVLHWDGDTWTEEPIGSGAPIYSVSGSGATVFAVGDIGTLARRTGGTWQTMAMSEFDDVYGMWGSSASDVWAVGGSQLLHSDGGGTWTFELTPDFTSMWGIWGSGPGDVWAAGDYGTVIHYDGVSWSTAHADSSLQLNTIWGTSTNDVWAGGFSGALVHWDGASWSTQTVGTGAFNGIWGSSSSNAFAVADDGSIEHWDGGAWTAMNSGASGTLYGVWGSGPSDVYAVGDGGTLLHYDGNVSGDWTPVSTPADPGMPIFAIWGSGPNDVFASANYGTTLLHYDGTSWRTMVPFSLNAEIGFYTLWGSGSRNVYAGGTLGTIIHGNR